MNHKTVSTAVFILAAGLTAVSNSAAEQITVADIIDNCRIKTNAEDLRGHLDFTFKNAAGKMLRDRKAIYFWKDYAGTEDLWSKVILVVLEPPRFQDVSYLRYEYNLASGREPDQWIFIPAEPRVRRLAMRDQSDQTWGIVGGDLQVLQMGDGEMRLLRTEEDERGTVYWIEIIPKTNELPYVKVHSAYVREDDGWDRCTRRRTEFFDKNDKLVKVLNEDWDQLQKFWYRRRIVVDNMETRLTEEGETEELRTIVEYVIHDVEFNTGLSDEVFTTRMLQHPARLTSGQL